MGPNPIEFRLKEWVKMMLLRTDILPDSEGAYTSFRESSTQDTPLAMAMSKGLEELFALSLCIKVVFR